jgi:hypothetical protein
MIAWPSTVRPNRSRTPASREHGQSRCWPLLAMLVAVGAAAGACSDDSDGPPAANPPAAEASASAQGAVSLIPDSVAKVQPSVVAILAGQSQGSGVVWRHRHQ